MKRHENLAKLANIEVGKGRQNTTGKQNNNLEYETLMGTGYRPISLEMTQNEKMNFKCCEISSVEKKFASCFQTQYLE